MMDFRPMQMDDLGAVTAIYNHYVKNTHATFDVDAFTIETRTPWFSQFGATRHQCWIAVIDNEPAGYACSMPLKPKAAYATSVEVSVYMKEGQGGRGIGRQLYDRLFDAIAPHDVHRAYALIAQPNEPSMKLHAAFGFNEVSRLNEVGRKFGRYWDVHWLERRF